MNLFKHPISIITAFSFLLLSSNSFSQSLEGRVTDEQGEPLPFATIYLPDRHAGTATNEEGYYRLTLQTGIHTVAFQYLGYKTEERSVNIRSGKNSLDVQLTAQPVELQDVRVSAEREDPAYTIMRKAIAKAKYHTQQLDSYTAKVYIKGSGRLTGLPFLFRKQIEKAIQEEGMDSTTAFITESVSEISYTRPNQYVEKVISIRTIGDDNNTSPASFIQSSFYEPEVNQAVSPLSPRAFAYYKFEYLGEFADRHHTINKIRVTPRSKGDNVFEGIIYIVDQLWSIHSLDLSTYLWGIRFEINQIYAPVEESVWLPVNNIYNVTGSVFGFKFEYRYFTRINDYEIDLNEDLHFEPEIIDDKLEAEKAREADAKLETGKTGKVLEKLSSGDEISRKELRKVLREYEKQEQEEFESEADSLQGVHYVTDFSIDSIAYKRDSSYWAAVRPIPLTNYELKGYHVMDSIAIAEAEEEKKNADDTLTITMGSENAFNLRSKSKFEPGDIILGGSYNLGKYRMEYHSPFMSAYYNTIDGTNGTLGLRLGRGKTPAVAWSIGTDLRYAFSRKTLNYRVLGSLHFGERSKRWNLNLSGGRFVAQFNEGEPISNALNSLMTVLFERNYMKLLEKEYVDVTLAKKWSDNLQTDFGFEWKRNHPLKNFGDYSLLKYDNRSFTSNIPYNEEIGDTYFTPYESSILHFSATVEPWIKYRIRNGKKYRIHSNSPVFSLYFEGALPGIAETRSSYSRLELGYKQDIEFAAGAVLNLNMLAGSFLNSEEILFPEFKHFPGNLTPLAAMDPAKSFRLLDYYAFSTKQDYLQVHGYYQMRKFLATQILWARLAGLRESVFVNSLVTGQASPYWEAGYGLNYILRIFRIELVASFLEEEYLNWGVRLGIASNFEALFGE